MTFFKSGTDSGSNILRLNFKNFGGEFQYHRLDKADIEYLKESFEDDKDSFLNTNLQGGESFAQAFWSGSYGPSMDNLEIINEYEDSKIDLDDVNKNRILYIDGHNNLNDNCLDYFYLTTGKVFGSYQIALADDEVFDPNKLTINYIEYCLDGYPEKYGTIIHNVEYDGELCDSEIADNGVDLYRCLLGYELLDGDLNDYLVVYDSYSQAVWDWMLCANIFSQDSNSRD